MPDLFTNAQAVAKRDDVLDALAVVVADVGDLHRRQLRTLFEWTGPDLRPAVANYVREHRPDLSAEVGAALLELEGQ